MKQAVCEESCRGKEFARIGVLAKDEIGLVLDILTPNRWFRG